MYGMYLKIIITIDFSLKILSEYWIVLFERAKFKRAANFMNFSHGQSKSNRNLENVPKAI